MKKLLDEIQASLYKKAKANLEQNTRPAKTLDEVKEIITQQGGFIETMWCGSEQCELKMKEEAGVTSRCIPFEQKQVGDKCVACGGKAEQMAVWGVAY